MALFTVSQSAEAVSVCLAQMTAGDALLLLGRAREWQPSPGELRPEIIVYALLEDEAQGDTPMPDGIALIDYDGWVLLSETHPQHVHWR